MDRKNTSTNILTFFIKHLDGYLTPAEIKIFVLRKYSRIIKEEESEITKSYLQCINHNLIVLGWIKGKKVFYNPKTLYLNKSSSEIDDWYKNLENDRVINNGIIAKDTGINIEFLEGNIDDLNSFASKEIENLLRFVEIKRKKSLKAFPGDLSEENKILEGLKISILFSRYARKNSDLRLLNTAFKMNDWYYPILKSANYGKPLVCYLLALTEQELSVLELLT